MSLQGFGLPEDGGYTSEGETNMKKLVSDHARKKKKSGGFQAMGLSRLVFRGLMKKGYNVPTPIQRKCIPVIMEGKDVVAMARTGSGKTACFLIPMFEKLLSGKNHQPGARAVIMSPTRELALQTLKFVKELGKFLPLKAAVILGGDSFEDQFSALHENPDIIIATPGRFMHVCVEMNLRLMNVEYVVFDEADRLFEMGFQEQLQDILNRLPQERQTLLFSATLPRLLVDFARAGLSDPTLIRLDVDTKIPEQLKLAFFMCKSEDKPALLLHFLTEKIDPREQTLVFVATKHHVEYVHLLLEAANVSNTYIYSSLDATARKINTAKFQMRKAKVLIVTDVAARGIDIPLLNNVINFSFPAKPKLFVHRVGRVARAGRSGVAYSMVESDEVPFLLDLHLFLGRTIQCVPSNGKVSSKEDWHGYTGTVPQYIVDGEGEVIKSFHDNSVEISNMKRVAQNGYKQYLKSRPKPSKESTRRVKTMNQDIGIHPLFQDEDHKVEVVDFLQKLKHFKPKQTVFEAFQNPMSPTFEVMKQKRKSHEKAIKKFHEIHTSTMEEENSESEDEDELEQSSEADLKATFSTVIAPKSSDKPFVPKKKKKQPKTFKDKENYIPHLAPDHHTERGLEVQDNFDKQAHGAVLDLVGDEEQQYRQQQSSYRWDKKRKKYTQAGQDPKNKKVRTESGALISASYRTDRYKKWRSRFKADANENEGSDNETKNKKGARLKIIRRGPRYGMNYAKKSNTTEGGKPVKTEVRRKEQILKSRKMKIERQMRTLKHEQKKSRNRAKAKAARRNK